MLSLYIDPFMLPERRHFCSKYVYGETMPGDVATDIYFSSDMDATGLTLCYSRTGGKCSIYF